MIITSPAGREYVWNGEADPTQADIDAIVAYDNSLSANEPKAAAAQAEPEKPKGVLESIKQSFINANKSDNQKARELLNSIDEQLVKEKYITQEQANAIKYAPQAGDINTVAQATGNVIKKAAPTAVRFGVPLGAAIISAPVEAASTGAATPAVMGFVASGAVLGEEIARKMEGRSPQTAVEAAMTGGLGAMMSPVKVAPGVANWLAGSAAEATAFAAYDAQQRGLDITKIDPKTLGINAAMSLAGRGFEAFTIANQARKAQQSFESAVFNRRNERAAAEVAAMEDFATAGIKEMPTPKEISEAVTPFDRYVYDAAAEAQQKPIREAAAAKQAEEQATKLAAQQAAESKSLIDRMNSELQVSGTDPFNKRPEFVRTKENTNLANLIGKDVTYSGYSGKLIRDTEGNFGVLKEVSKKGEPAFIEVADSGKNAGLLADDVGVVPKDGWDKPVPVSQSPEILQAIVEKNNLADDFNRQANELRLSESLANQTPVPVAPKKPRTGLNEQAFRSNYGRINPTVMLGLGRAGIGYAAGVAIGDTPEEDMGYGLGLALAGAVISPSVARKIGASFKENARKLVPEITLKPFMEVIHATQDDAKALLVKSSFAKRQLEQSLASIADPQTRVAASLSSYKYLTGEIALNQVHPALQSASVNARESIDELTDTLISRGLAKGELKETLLDNKGKYLRRSYQLFLDEKFVPSKVDFDNWINANVQKQLSNPKNVKSKALLVEEFTDEANSLLDRNKASNYVLTGSAKGTKHIFTARDASIDALTRKLYGEIHDPVALMGDTAPRMANAAAAYQANSKIADIGLSLGLFDRKSSSIPGKTVRLVSEEDVNSPFSGLWASPEMRSALNNIQKTDAGNVVKAWNLVNSQMKAAKTIGSAKAYISNVWGGTMDVVAQGHGFEFLRPSNWKNGITNAALTFDLYDKGGKLSQNKSIKLYEDFVREGLIDKSVSGQDFANAFSQSFFQKNFGNSFIDKPLGLFRKAQEMAGKVYSTPETFSKVFNMAGEIRGLKAANTGLTDAEIFKEAAKKVRALTATPRAQWKIVKQLSTIGALDPFVAYTADRYRVVYNTYKIGLSEIASKNAGIRAMGYKRIAAMTTVLGAGAAVGANYGIPDDEEKSLRSMVPDYAKNGTLYLTRPDKDGNFTFTNLNYNVPQTIVMEAAASAIRGDSPSESVKNFFGALSSQMFGENLMFGIASQIYQNESNRGIQIRSENDPLLSQAMGVGKFILTEGFVPIAVNEAIRIKDAWDKPIVSPSGRVVTREDLFNANLMGVRTMRMNLRDVVASRSRGINAQMSNDNTQYKSEYRNSMTDDQRQGAFNKLLQRDQQSFSNVKSLFDNAKTLGIDSNDLIELAKGLPSRTVAGALDNIYVPPKMERDKSPSDVISEMYDSGKSRNEIISEIRNISNTNPFEAKRLMDAVRASFIEEKRGITNEDKLLDSFSEANGDRASYIAKKMQKIAAEQGQIMAKVYYDDLMKKRIITPAVKAQLNSAGISFKSSSFP